MIILLVYSVLGLNAPRNTGGIIGDLTLNQMLWQPLISSGKTFESRDHPVKSNICCRFEKFAAPFTRKENNYKKAYIFKNTLIRRGENENGLLCENFFGRNNSFETFSKI
jgi:hypothetical protein